jgi:hypothetical protein
MIESPSAINENLSAFSAAKFINTSSLKRWVFATWLTLCHMMRPQSYLIVIDPLPTTRLLCLAGLPATLLCPEPVTNASTSLATFALIVPEPITPNLAFFVVHLHEILWVGDHSSLW